MPVFECRAMDTGGNMTRVVIEADNQAAAASEVRSRGLTVISVEEVSVGSMLSVLSLSRFMPVTNKDKVLLFRMLATLVKSEVTVTGALRLLYEQTDKANMKIILSDILSRVEGGAPLSNAMSFHPRVFSSMMINLVRAGEMGGILETVFERIADFIERRANLRKKLFMSFFYPGIVFLVGIAVVIFMVVFVIPKFMGLIRGKLPPVTQLLMDTTAFFQAHGQSMITYFAGFIIAIVLLHALPFTRYYLDRYKVNLPIFGPVIRLGVVVAFARTFSVLLESRIPMTEALRATSATISNTAVQRFLDGVVERVMAGEPLSATLQDSWAFTSMTGSMANIGEHSGLMSESMNTVAEVHEEIMEDKIARMSAMVEPALILLLGALVGLVVYGLISGMLAMYAGAV